MRGGRGCFVEVVGDVVCGLVWFGFFFFFFFSCFFISFQKTNTKVARLCGPDIARTDIATTTPVGCAANFNEGCGSHAN